MLICILYLLKQLSKQVPSSMVVYLSKVYIMVKRNIIVIGASAGGFEVIKKIVQHLPPDFDASIFIVWHMSPEVHGILPEVLNKFKTIYAAHAVDKEPIQSRRIYVAPPDHHLILEQGIISVTHGPKENRFRPAVDPLFRSAAYSYGNRVIGVILSGALDDGTAGLWRVKANGGIAVVQDPADAEVTSMPESALREVQVDHCVPVSELADLLVNLSSQEIAPNNQIVKDEQTKSEIEIASQENALESGAMDLGVLSPFACPECHGVLSKIMEGSMARYRCHTGHAYSADALLVALSENIENGLYSAVRAMDESIMLLNHVGDHYAEINQPKLAAVYFQKGRQTMERSTLVRKAVHEHEQLSKDKLLAEVKKHP